MLLILETIDLNGIQSLYAISNRLNLNDVLPNKVTIWQLRNNNPLRKSYVNNNIKLNEFDALIKITVELSRYLYPYIRELLQSKEDLENQVVDLSIKSDSLISVLNYQKSYLTNIQNLSLIHI